MLTIANSYPGGVLVVERPEFEIFGPVVVPDPVFVMDAFARMQLAPKFSGQHDSMFHLPMTGKPDLHVAIGRASSGPFDRSSACAIPIL